MNNKKPIYADNSATTKVRDEVAEVMLKILKEDFGNPSSMHQYGRKAKLYLEEARGSISSLINAQEDQQYCEIENKLEPNKRTKVPVQKQWGIE